MKILKYVKWNQLVPKERERMLAKKEMIECLLERKKELGFTYERWANDSDVSKRKIWLFINFGYIRVNDLIGISNALNFDVVIGLSDRNNNY